MHAMRIVVKPHQDRISPAEAPWEIGAGVDAGGEDLDFFDATDLGALV
jgi:hypothetical protein